MTHQDSLHNSLKNGLIRKVDTIQAPDGKFLFKIPQEWVQWSNEQPERPNIHLTKDQLFKVKYAEGEWDYEFSEVLNNILPFESCIVHIGSEGWGKDGISYTDLQFRIYNLKDDLKIEPPKLAESARLFAEKLVGNVSLEKSFDSNDRNKFTISYPRLYDDYGAIAKLDFYTIEPDGMQLVFVFMHTNQRDQSETIENILNSLKIK